MTDYEQRAREWLEPIIGTCDCPPLPIYPGTGGAKAACDSLAAEFRRIDKQARLEERRAWSGCIDG